MGLDQTVLAYNSGGEGPHTDVLRVRTMVSAMGRLSALCSPKGSIDALSSPLPELFPGTSSISGDFFLLLLFIPFLSTLFLDYFTVA